jgi:hypothetical protein
MLAVKEEAEAVVNIAMVKRMGATWRVMPFYPPPSGNFDRRSLHP